MQANDLSLSIHNPELIYSFLALYGVLTVGLMMYVHSKFRSAGRMLKLLQNEWTSAESKHTSIVGIAQERLAKLSAPAPTVNTLLARNAIGSDIRKQIVVMAKRGKTPNDIARTCGLQEGEVDVILGMARLQK